MKLKWNDVIVKNGLIFQKYTIWAHPDKKACELVSIDPSYFNNVVPNNKKNSLTIPSSFFYDDELYDVKVDKNQMFMHRLLWSYSQLNSNIKPILNNITTLVITPELSNWWYTDLPNLQTIVIPNETQELKHAGLYSSITPELKNIRMVVCADHPTFGLIENLEGQILVKKVNGETKLLPDCSNIVQGFVTGNIVLPDYINSIGKEAFRGCEALQSITIPNTVVSIKQSAFENCYNLKQVSLPNSIKQIEQFAFNGCCGLKAITIPNKVKQIESTTFNNCWNLQSITIPDSVTSIDNYAFGHCVSLKSLTIPHSVKTINLRAFDECFHLSKVNCSQEISNLITSSNLTHWSLLGCGINITLPEKKKSR